MEKQEKYKTDFQERIPEEIKKLVSGNTHVFSILYDLDLLPEQINSWENYRELLAFHAGYLAKESENAMLLRNIQHNRKLAESATIAKTTDKE